jgi:hypothetical protein
VTSSRLASPHRLLLLLLLLLLLSPLVTI